MLGYLKIVVQATNTLEISDQNLILDSYAQLQIML